MTMVRSYVIISVVLFGIVLNTVGANMPVDITMKPENASLFPGEPCVLVLTLTNKADANIEVDFGADGLAAFSFAIQNHEGEEITKGTLPPHPGLSRKGRKLIAANATLTKRLILNQWCSTRIPAGKYRVIGTLTSATTGTINAQCDLEIQRDNPDALARLLLDVAASILESDARSERSFGVRKLAFSRSPQAVEPLSKIIVDEQIEEHLRVEAIYGLERVGTVDAVEELARIRGVADLAPGFTVRLKKELTSVLFRLGDTSGNPTVVDICRRATKDFQRPVERAIRD